MTLDAYARFLTARWDEIERYRDDLHDVSACRRTWDGWEYEGDCTCGKPAHVLADLAAKRAILDLARGWETSAARHCGPTDIAWVGGRAQAITGETVVRKLAAPFRDHPDHPAHQEA